MTLDTGCVPCGHSRDSIGAQSIRASVRRWRSWVVVISFLLGIGWTEGAARAEDASAATPADAGAGKEPGTKSTSTDLPTSRLFYVQLGTLSQSPFTVDSVRAVDATTNPVVAAPDTGTNSVFYIDSSSQTDVKGFLEARVRHRRVWSRWYESIKHPNEKEIDDEGEVIWLCGRGWGWNGEKHKFAVKKKRFRDCVEGDFRAEFTFGGNDNPSATAIAGSGDLGSTIVLGLPLIGVVQKDGLSVALSLDGLVSVVTDRKVQDVHDRMGVGASINIGIPMRPVSIAGTGQGMPERLAEFSVRASGNWLEEPKQTGQQVDLGNGKRRAVVGGKTTGFPDFSTGKSLGLDVDLLVPFGEMGYLVAGASIFGQELNPNPWSVRLGLTVPFESIIGAFARQTSAQGKEQSQPVAASPQ